MDKNRGIEKEDYDLPDPDAADSGFKSFNEFFARPLKDQAKSRPQTMPDRDYVISAPTDCIMNSIPQLIANANTLIPTKGNQALNACRIVGMLITDSDNPHGSHFPAPHRPYSL